MAEAERIRVLLVEDSAGEAELVRAVLAFARNPRFDVVHVARLAAAVEALAAGPFDVVLLDLGLPDAQGLEGVSAVRAAAPGTAIVVRSGLGDERVALAALEAGAQDYIMKSATDADERLARSIRFAMARREAEESSRRLATIVENSDDAIVGITKDGVITSFNPGAERLYGYAADEMIGRSAHLLLAPGTEPVTVSARGHQTRHQRKDASIVEVSVTMSPVEDSAGGLIAYAAIVRDVTHLAEAARFFELSSDMMCAAGLDGTFSKLNGIWERVLGWHGDEMLGRAFTDFVHADHLGPAVAMAKRVAKGGSVAEFECRMLTKAGTYRWLSWSASGVPEQGLIYATARDVTARVEAETAKREAERRFGQAFEEAPTGMALTDLDGHFVLVNQALSDITGHPRDQLLKTSVPSLLEPNRVKGWRATVAGLLSGELTSERSDTAYRDAAGRPIPVDSSVTLLRDHEGNAQHLLVQMIDISERKRFEGQLQYLADHDALSGMFNRRRFLQELQRESSLAERYGTGGAVLAIDLDNFKYVNDSLGHSVGDELITRTASIMRLRLRETDITGRLGGDEFAAILPRADMHTAMQVANELLEALREAGPAASHAAVSRVTASIGITMFGGQAEDDRSATLTAEELLVEADIALYDAKEAGRDRVAMYDAAKDRHKRMEARLTWADRIRRAIEQESFELHAQPILGLNGDHAARHELLIRMVGEKGDLIPPGTFLYIAERFDLIQAIDRWVMRQGIRLLAEHKHRGETLNLQVNLSAKSVAAPDFIDYIASELAAEGIDGHGLCVEITETAAIVNVDSAKRFAEDLRRLGGELALDDFGAGFASFYYLKHLTFDYVKIDGEFIKDLTSSPINQLIVQAIVAIGRGIGKHTIAEFVGDEATLKLIERYGVDYAQGFHLGKPVALGDRSLAPVQLPSRVSH